MNNFHYRLECTTAPASEPVTNAEADNFLKLHSDAQSADSDLIDDYIQAARQTAETYMNRAIFTQTWTMSLDSQPSVPIYLPKGYIQSVTSVTTYQDDGTSTTESSTDDYNTVTGERGFIMLRSGGGWTATDRKYDRMRIVYVAGWYAVGNAGGNTPVIPDAVKQAILHIIAAMYDQRTTSVDIPKQAKDLMYQYKRHLL